MSVSPALLISFNIYELLAVFFFWLTRAHVHISFPMSVPLCCSIESYGHSANCTIFPLSSVENYLQWFLPVTLTGINEAGFVVMLREAEKEK